jgi:Leucine-rich repeat (LRR) protein
MLNSEGRVQGSTLLGYTPIKVQIKPVDSPDSDPKGRKVYIIVPDVGEQKRRYYLVLSLNEAGPHDLLIREGEKAVGTYPLVDPDREEHQTLGSKLSRASAKEQNAIADLRKCVGYSFHFRLEANNAVTFLYFPEAGDICRFDTALRGLKNLTHLSFRRGRLGPEGLESIRQMPLLKTLDFTDSDIDDAGLACLKGAAQLSSMSFFGSRGLSDKGVAQLQGLQNLKRFDLRNESFTATEPKAPRITDAGLKHLAGLTKLEYLNLQGQHITDVGLKHLSGMTHLESLALSFSGITDKGLRHLEGLRKLRNLHLYGTRVTAAGKSGASADSATGHR